MLALSDLRHTYRSWLDAVGDGYHRAEGAHAACRHPYDAELWEDRFERDEASELEDYTESF